MKKMAVLSIAILVFSVCAGLPAFAGGLVKATSKNPEAQKLIDKAWALERSDSSAEIFKQCIAWMEQADKLDPNNPAILSDLARYYWSYGDQLPKATPEQKKILEGIYAKGLAYAEKSLKVKETAAAHYWLAVNKAAGLEFSNIMTQAAAFPVIYKHSKYVTANDPAYDYGANGRLWTEILVRVPKKAVELVGEKYVDEAIMEIDNALKAEPRYFDNYLYKARFVNTYYGRKDEALKLLDTILKQDPNVFPEEVVANKIAQKNARILWKKLTGKDYPQK
jgi:tetratricopeptide (TPR) repeat protein